MDNCTDLKISPNGRFILKKDNSPFFWLADTAWEIFHRLTKKEATEYLATRAAQGFSIIQAVALSEFDGLVSPNAYGQTPLKKNSYGDFDPGLPDVEPDKYDYWDHVDFVIDAARSLGLYIGLLPTWGDKYNLMGGTGPVIFTPENAYIYGKWIGERYSDRTNIIWILGGDRPIENEMQMQIVANMAAGIKESTNGRHLMSYHPRGGQSSSEYAHTEPWLDFNMIQSGHGALYIKNFEQIEKDRSLFPIKPTLDREPRYEDAPVNFDAQNGYFSDHEVRTAAYWAILSGALGHTYGHHSIWSFAKSETDYFPERKGYFPIKWREALNRPGGAQMKYVKELFMSRPFLELEPCQKLLHENYGGANHMAVAKGKSYAFVYTPNGLGIKLNMGILEGEQVVVCWYDPKSGIYAYADTVKNEGVVTFAPPSSGKNNDWVLVLDALDDLGDLEID